jgi:Glycosyl transferase family 2
MMPTIAVVLPNRNDSGHLAESIDSVLQQDERPDQFIVVDDQSTDNSLDIIHDKLNDVSGAKIIRNSNCLGTMAAANEGLKHVDSDYVLFLSSNDYLINGIFKRAKSCLSVNDQPGVWSAMVTATDENGRHLYLYPSPVISLTDTFLSPEQCIHLAVSVGHWFTGTTTLFHRETLLKLGGLDEAYQGLADMMAAITIASIKGAAFSPEPYGVMRQHAGGLMWRTSRNLPGLDLILDKMADEAPKLSPALFSSKYTKLMQRRIRFTAIRTFQDDSWLNHARLWQGQRYKLLHAVIPVFGKQRKLQLITAFLLLRPFKDLFAIVWYRIFGVLFVSSRMKIKQFFR